MVVVAALVGRGDWLAAIVVYHSRYLDDEEPVFVEKTVNMGSKE